MPRLKDSNVSASAISEGTGSRDLFGLAQGNVTASMLALLSVNVQSYIWKPTY